ncbi:MAG: DUF1800 domain-containing protein [Steroidobacteraceae bacterium]
MKMTVRSPIAYQRIAYPSMLLLAACLSLPVQAAEATLSREDMQWLNRVTYGVDSATLEQYRKLGRKKFLDAQLSAQQVGLPADIATQIDSLEVSQHTAQQWLQLIASENQRINALTDEMDKQAARKTLNEHANKLAYEAARRHLLNAIYSPAQLREQMVWFWLNHFSVFQGKGNVNWLAADYERAIRSQSLGHFRELVLATLKHPAMLQYLDNAQNAVNRINENYSRELMELHILGVNGGYTQQDVQELARVLTGVGINATDNAPKLKAEWQPLYRHEDAFEFNPARHDFGNKTLLGKQIAGSGFNEVEQAVDLLVAQPACARFISNKLATYFIGDTPSEALLADMVKTFQRSNGDIAAVLRSLLSSREFAAAGGKQFKDPMHYVISSVRLAYDGKSIANSHPIVNWLNALGEPLFGRQTPDGYPLAAINWSSSGQLSKRFEIARAIGSGNGGLFEPEDGSPPTRAGFPQLATPLYFQYLQPQLSKTTLAALDKATSQQEWNTYLLGSPEFNY